MTPRDAVAAEIPETAVATRRSWIAGLGRGDKVEGVYLVRRLELRQRAGASTLALELLDRTGSIAARFAHPPAGLLDALREARYARARGSVVAEPSEEREGATESRVELAELAPASAESVELRDLHEHTPEDPEALLQELRLTFQAAVPDAWIRRLLLAFLDDAALVQKLKTAPAASSFHHAYVGGLLEHIASLARLAIHVCASYPRLDQSLVLAGVFLHDIGKVDELSWESGLQYTDRGQLVGHIGIGLLLLEEKIRAIPGFPPRLRDVLGHLILSHHGTKEFGSPVLPVTPEALAVHHLDNLDGKLWSAWRAQDDPRGDPSWSAHNRHLGRKIYRGTLDGA